jgi:hypothetical protein
MDYIEPPSDPNEWTDEQWIEWLKATDDVSSVQPDESISKVVRRIVQSTPGQALGQAMLGTPNVHRWSLNQARLRRPENGVMVIVVTYQVCHHPLTGRRRPLALESGSGQRHRCSLRK